MSAAFVPSWPGSRALLGWWRELADRKPQQLRLSRLLLHRVEALVLVGRLLPLDRWQRALLGLANARMSHNGEISTLNDLQLDIQVLGQLVRELVDKGLLRPCSTGLWRMTPAGHAALASGAVRVSTEERRAFAFVDNSTLGRSSHFLPLDLGLARRAGTAAAKAEGCSFQTDPLEECIRQSPQWKARFRFPADVEALLPPQPNESPAANWRRVVVDSVEQWFFVFVQTAQTSGAPPLLGFSVRPEGWVLQPQPLLELAAGWQEALPDLAVEPTLQMWRQAWQAWSQPRSLPQTEVAACRLERMDHRLLVHAPLRLIERLRAARSDAVKQEAWLLAGEGRTRSAAQIELHPL